MQGGKTSLSIAGAESTEYAFEKEWILTPIHTTQRHKSKCDLMWKVKQVKMSGT